MPIVYIKVHISTVATDFVLMCVAALQFLNKVEAFFNINAKVFQFESILYILHVKLTINGSMYKAP